MTSTPNGERPNNDASRTTSSSGSPPQLRAGGSRFRQKKTELPKYDYEHYSRLAGPLTRPDPDKPYTVRYRSLLADEPHRIRAALLLGAAPLVSFGLLVWLMQPSHWTERDYPAYDFLPVLDVVIAAVSIGLIELFRCMNVLSNAHATLVARDPIPVIPESGTRITFLTSFVPGKEPLAMVTNAGGGGQDPPPRAAARLAAGRGRRPRRQGSLPAPGRPSLQPQGRPGVEPGQGPAPRQDQARQLQRLAPGAR